VEQLRRESELLLAAQVAGEDCIPELVARLVAQQAAIVSVAPRGHSLEEIYFELQRQGQGGDA
ncbi:MAG: hypothetical protein JXR83_06755, partial [Deltaproteobacteria bacterium]|nr:hypothetical protein [Deltaproteobacteria bacterium]